MLTKAMDKIADADSGKVNILASMPEQIERNGWFFGHKTRLLIMILSTACLSVIMANSLALNFTVICMVDEHSLDDGSNVSLSTNGTIEPKPLFTEQQQSLLFSAIAIGTIIGTIPISYLSANFGVRKSFTVYGIISAFSTLLVPLSVMRGGFGFVFLMRVLQGFSVATSFPAMGSIISEWSTTKRSGAYIALLSIHLQMGSIITMPMAGELCASQFGWQAVYYILGISTFILFCLFFAFYRDSASMHRNVSSKELVIIQKNKPHMAKLNENEKTKVPYRALFTDLPVLGCIVSCFSSNLGYNVFIQYGPLYLNKVLGFNVQKTGLIAAVPALICIFVKFLAGPLSDSIPCINARGRIILFATVSQVGLAGCFVTLAFLPPGVPEIAQIFFTGAIVFSGLNCVGVIKSCQLISGKYSYIIMATHSFTNSVIVLLLPALVAFVAPNNTREEWARILIFVASLVVTAIFLFDLSAEATPRPWAMASCPSTQKDQNLLSVIKTHPISVNDLVLNVGQPKVKHQEV